MSFPSATFFPAGKFMARAKVDHVEVFSSKRPYWRKRVAIQRGTVMQIEVLDNGVLGLSYRWWRTDKTYWVSASSPVDRFEAA